MASHLSNGSTAANGAPSSSFSSSSSGPRGKGGGTGGGGGGGVALCDLPKSNVFTSKLPPDPAFPTPRDSHKVDRKELGPRIVRGALYTYVRPEAQVGPELLAVSGRALQDIGLREGEEETEDFKAMVAGNKMFWEDTKPEGEDGGGGGGGSGIYPWAQCYGGWQFGSWAGQLGDGRAISLFESTNPDTKTRYEIQLKGAGRTPYSRFADGKAVLRSSLREFVVSEALNALGIPTTRALSLTLLPNQRVFRETTEPGAIVARFAQSWIRIGTFDILRARGDRDLIRTLAGYVAEEVFGGWEALPTVVAGNEKTSNALLNPSRGVAANALQGKEGAEENRYARLYREVARRNAKTVAAWQAYAFTNGVLNTDNTSIMGLSVDFGPFAFVDNFDPNYTPNHDDHMLRYSYKNQPTIIWWNLVRLGESLGELIGSGDRVDEEEFVEKGVREEFAPILVKRAENIIDQTGEEYQAVFLAEYKRLMSARLGLKTSKESDFEELFSEILDTMAELELDFNHFFRRLSSVKLADVHDGERRKDIAKTFFHSEGVTGIGNDESSAKEKIAQWLARWRERIIEDWGADADADAEREKAMKAVNPKFLPRSWILDEAIERTEKQGDREFLRGVLHMALNPFQERWGWNEEEEERLCGDVPRYQRAMMCSCSS